MSKVKVQGNPSGTGTLTIAAPDTNSDFTLSLPATTAPILAGSGITLSASAPANTLVTDASGNVVIGTSSPVGKVTSTVNFSNGATASNFTAQALGTAQGQLAGYSFRPTFVGVGDNIPRRAADIWSGYAGGVWGTEYLSFGVGRGGSANDASDVTIERMRIAGNGAQSSVIPGGSTLYPEFKCRAWVNFNGTGTVAIRASGNVSSITDDGTGQYTVNLTTAMPDTSYAVCCSGSNTVNGTPYLGFRGIGQSITTSSFKVTGSNGGNGIVDLDWAFVSVFR
jgi:hypothetical protein